MRRAWIALFASVAMMLSWSALFGQYGYVTGGASGVAEVSPASAMPGTAFHFVATYTYATPPMMMQVAITDPSMGVSTYNMVEADAADVTYSDGKVYYYDAVLNTPGTYQYQFKTNTGVTADETTIAAGPTVDATIGRLEGIIRDGRNSLPLDGATVTIPSESKSDTTGPDGYYSFDLLPGTYQVQASKPGSGLQPKSGTQTVGSGAASQLDLALDPFGTVHGTVTQLDAAGNPAGALANANVGLYAIDAYQLIGGATSQADGSYTITEVPTGTFTLRVSPPAAPLVREEWTTVTVGVGADVTQNVAVRTGATVRVTDVVDEKGGSLPYSSVLIEGPYPSGPHHLSDSGTLEGAVVFSQLWAGTYRLTVSPPAARYDLPTRTLWVQVAPGDDVAKVVTLPAGATIRGTVRDYAGQPVANAIVDAHYPPGGGYVDEKAVGAQGSSSGSATTDASGAYEITGLYAGEYEVDTVLTGSAPADAVLGAPRRIQVAGGATVSGIDLAWARGGTITGRVTDGTNGLGYATVGVYDEDGDQIGWAEADQNGYYTVEHLPAGHWRMDAGWSSPHLVRFHEWVTVTSGAATTRDIVLPLGGSIAVKVLAPDGLTPVMGAYVSVDPMGGGLSRYTGSDGVATIGGLDTGTYRATVSMSGYVTSTVEGIAVTRGNSTSRDVIMKTAATLSGTVKNSASVGLVGATLTLSGPGYWQQQSSTTGGLFSFTQMPEGRYTLMASPPNGSAYLPRSLNVFVKAGQAASAPVVLADSGCISGRVLDHLGGAITGATVETTNVETGAQKSTSSSSGNFQLVGLDPGVYNVTIIPPVGVAELPRTVSHVQVGTTTKALGDIQLSQASVLAGTVRDNYGFPVSSYAYLTVHYTLNYQRMTEYHVALNGVFSLNLPAGSVSVDVSPNGPSLLPTTIYETLGPGEVKSRDVNLAAAPAPGSVKVTVTHASQPLAQCSVGLTSNGGTPYFSAMPTDASGVATFVGVPVGTYSVDVTPPAEYVNPVNAAQLNIKPVVVTSGAETPVAAALQTGGVLKGKLTHNGVPVTDSNVSITNEQSGSSFSAYVDGSGMFRAARLTAGTYRLGVDYESEGGQQAPRHISGIQVNFGEEVTRDLDLTAGGTLTVEVKGVIEGMLTRVPGAYVSVDGAYDSRSDNADGNGKTVFPFLEPGVYHVSAEAPDGTNLLDSPTADVTVMEGQNNALVVTLPTAGVLVGQVTDGTNPVAFATVTIRPGSGHVSVSNGTSGSLTMLTDEQGRFRFDRLVGDAVDVAVTPPDRQNLAPLHIGRLPLASGADTTLNPVLRAGGTVQGTVTVAGQPVQDAPVCLSVDGSTDPLTDVTTDAEGKFAINQLGVGTYRLRVSPPATMDAAFQERTVIIDQPGATVTADFALPGGSSLDGNVKDAAVLNAVGGGHIALSVEGGAWRGSASVDSSGHFHFGGLAAGRYRIEYPDPGYSDEVNGVRARGLMPGRVDNIDVGVGSQVTQDVLLPAGASIFGQVTDAQGSPVGYTTVALETHTGIIGSAASDAAGYYRIDGLTPGGSATLTATPPYNRGFATYRFNDLALPAGSTEVPITLDPEASIQARVVDGSGTPVMGATLQVQESNRTYGTNASAIANMDGAARVGRLAGGLYSVAIIPPTSAGPLLLERRLDALKLGAGEARDLGTVTLTTGGSISGQVTNGASGVPGVQVTAGSSAPVMTDSSGNYRIAGLAPGFYDLRAVPDPSANLAPGGMAGVEVTAGADTQRTLVLSSGGAIHGVVRDPGGAPVPALTLRLQMGSSSGPSIATGPDGSYRFAGLVRGTYSLHAVPDLSTGLVESTFGNIVVDGGQDVLKDLTLPRGGSISGVVRYPDGKPAPYARVSLLAQDEVRLGTVADDAGRYELKGFPTGIYTVVACDGDSSSSTGGASGSVSCTASATAGPGTAGLSMPNPQSLNVDLNLMPLAHVKVTVKDASGQPVAGAQVSLQVADLTFRGGRATTATDTEGEADISAVTHPDLGAIGLPDGRCGVSVAPPAGRNLVPQGKTVDAMSGTTVTSIITLGTGASISGRVTDSTSAGLAGATVTLFGRDGSRSPVSRETDITGAYLIEGLTPGIYDVSVQPGSANPRFLGRSLGGIELLVGSPVTQDIALDRGARVTGQITEMPGSVPLANAAVQFTLPGARSEKNIQRVFTTDLNGNYVTSGLPAGTWNVQVSAPGYRNLAIGGGRISLGVGDEKTFGLSLNPGGAIEGVVKDTQGNPIPGVDVTVQGVTVPGAAGEPVSITSTTDFGGWYRVSQLWWSSYDIVVASTSTQYPSQQVTAVIVGAGQTVTRNFVLRETGQIKGTVTSGGKPVAGARVYCTSMMQFDGSNGGVYTSDNGVFHMARVPAGPQHVTVVPPPGLNLLGASRDGVDVISRQDTQVDFVLTAGSILRVVAQDGSSKPIQNAQVTVVRSERGGSHVNGMTDAAGLCVLPQLPADRYDVKVQPPAELASDLIAVTVHNQILGVGQTVNVPVTLARGGSIEGVVKDAAGTPVHGYVSIRGIGANDLGAPVYGGTWQELPVGVDGSYRCTALPAGTYSIRAQASSESLMLAQETRVVVTAGATTRKDFALQQGASITGQLRDSSGTPLVLPLFAVRDGAGDEDPPQAEIDGAGVYHFDGLAAGVYHLQVSVPEGVNLVPQVVTVTVPAGGFVTKNITVPTGAVLTGQVKDAGGQPVVGAEVVIEGAGPRFEAETDGAGKYRFGGLPGGTFDVEVRAPAGAPVLGQVVRGVVVNSGATVVRDIPLAAASAIEGTLVDRGGNPVAGATVDLYGAGVPVIAYMHGGSNTITSRSAGLDYNAWSQVVTDSAGKFRFGGLPAGHFTVRATPARNVGLAPASAAVDLLLGQTATPTVALGLPAWVTGVVKATNGAVLPGVQVRISSAESIDSTTTDDAGAFSFTNLAAGRYRIQVIAPYGEGSGHLTFDVELAEGASWSKEITLAATGSLSGVVRGPAGVVAGARVEVTGQEYMDARQAGADGSFSFNYLAAGSYRVVITPPAGSSLNVLDDEVVLGPGQALSHDFTLVGATGAVSGTVSFQGAQTGDIIVGLFAASSSYGSTSGKSRAAARTRGWVAIDETAVGTNGPLFSVKAGTGGAFTLTGVPEGQYHVLAVMDVNGNGQVDPGEPIGKYGSPNAVFVKGSLAVTGVRIALHLPSASVQMGTGLVSPQTASPGATISFRVKASGADSVFAEVRNAATGASVARVQLADDGTQSDGAPADGEFGGSTTAPAAGDYYVDFEGVNEQGSLVRAAEVGFTTATFSKATNILLVNSDADRHLLQIDSQGNQELLDEGSASISGSLSVESYYTSILSGSGRTCDVWRTTCRGEVPAATLQSYAGAGSAVLIVAPYNTASDTYVASTGAITQFLDSGGRLFIASQDLGRACEGHDAERFDTFYRDYVHAGLLTASGTYALAGRPGDPLSNGLGFRVSGGDGANNQWSGDAIVALPPAQPVAYFDSSTAAMTRGAGRVMRRGVQVLFPRAAARPAPSRAYSQNETDYELCAGLRMDNGRYKVVYLAFGIEAIADQASRTALLTRSLDFLLTPAATTTTLQVSADKASLPADDFSTSTLTVQAKDSGGSPVPDGTLVSFRGYNGSLSAAAIGTMGGQATVVFKAGHHAAPMRVEVSSGAALGGVSFNGLPAPPAVLSARAIDVTHVEVQFDRAMSPAAAGVAANYTITPPLAVTAAALDVDPSRVILTTASQLGFNYTVTVQSVPDTANVPLGARAAASFVGSGPQPVVTVTAGRSAILADGLDATSVKATVTLPGGGPVADGVPVAFSASGGLVSPAQGTTVNGQVSTAFTTSTAGAATITATVGQATGNATVQALDPATLNLMVAANPAVVPNNGTTASTITATLKDGAGNPLSGFPLSFSTTLGTLTPAGATTVNGVLTAGITGSTVGMATVTAKVGIRTATTTVEFAQPLAAHDVVITADPVAIPADGMTFSALTITVKDAFGTAVPDNTVVLLSATSGSVIPIGTTQGGVVRTNYQAPTAAGVATITATADSATGTANITLIQTASITGTVSPDTLAADGAGKATLSLDIVDKWSKPVPDGTPVQLAATTGTLAASPATTTGGKLTATYTAGTTPGTAKLSATVGTTTKEFSVTLLDPKIVAAMDVTANPTTLPADGKSTAKISISATHSLGGPAIGAPLTISADSGSLSATNTTLTSQPLVVTYTAPATSGTATITVTSGSVTKTVTITLTPVTTGTVVVTPNVTTLPADGTSTATITVTVKDGAGKLVADGTAVTLSASAGTLSKTSGTTIAGKVTGIVYTAGTAAGTATISATSGTASGEATITLVDTGAPTAMALTATPLTLPADGVTPVSVKVTLTNALGKAVTSDVAVTLSATAGTIPASVTTAAGTATVTYTPSTTPGTVTVTATAGTLSKSVSLTLTDQTTVYGTVPFPSGTTVPAGSVIELRDPTTDAVVATATIGPDGKFRVSGAPGSYDVVLRSTGYVPLRIRGVNLSRAESRAVAQEAQFVLLPQPSFGTGMRMVTMPFYFKQGAMEKVVGDTDVVAWIYDPALARYRMTGTADFPMAQAGQGFWLKQRRASLGAPYQIAEPAEVPAQNQPLDISLLNGWQLIGNPYATKTLSLANLKILLPGDSTEKDFRTPGASDPWRSHLWGWTGTSYELVSSVAVGASQSVAPYRAYWLRTTAAGLKLRFVPPATTLAEEPPARSRADQDGWTARIVARAGDRADTDNFIGIGRNALTIEGPPPMEGYVDVRLLAPDCRTAAVDIREKTAGRTAWEFEVDTDLEGEDVTLTWPNLSQVPRDVRLVLVDQDSGDRRQMRTSAGLTFRAGNAPRRFRVEAETGAGPIIAVTGITATPVRGGGRSIGYTLSGEASTDVTIVSPTGRVIKHVADHKVGRAGRNETYWDGTDDRGVVISGVVLLNVTATTADGATVRGTRPVVLTR